MNVTGLINLTAKNLNIIGLGGTLDPSHIADIHILLNDMLSAWNNEGLIVYQNTRTTATFLASTATRTIGLTGDIVIAKPEVEDLLRVTRVDANNLETPLELLRRMEEWAAVLDKTATASVMERLFYNPTHPDGTFTAHPIQTSNTTVAIYHKTKISQFASLLDTVDLPDGYQRAIRLNLAIEIAPMFDVPLTRIPDIASLAISSKAWIKAKNMKTGALKCDMEGTQGGGEYDVATDSYR